MAGAGSKKSGKRRGDALRFWGALGGAVWLLVAALHALRSWASLTRWAALALALELAVYAGCAYMIAGAAADADEGHGSALSADGGAAGARASEPWKDVFYITAACQLLSLVSSWGWTAAAVLVPAYLAWTATSAARAAWAAARAMLPGGVPVPGGEAGAAAREAEQSRSRAKRERQREEAARRVKGR